MSQSFAGEPSGITPIRLNIVVASLRNLCEHRIYQAVSQEDVEQHDIALKALIERVADIVARNVDSGRAERVMRMSRRAAVQEGRSSSTNSGAPEVREGESEQTGTDGPSRLEAYIDRVVVCYLEEHSRVEGLAARDGAAWADFYEQLVGRAYNMLLRLHVPAARAANEAPDFAQETCEIVFSQAFPYDVSFDAWSTLILKNQILKRYTRSQDLIDRERGLLSLDRPSQHEADGDFSLYHLLADESSESAFDHIGVQERLLQAIARLRSRAQQQVIIYTFFYELSNNEIARRLNRTKQAVYNLRHRALLHLKQILGE